jgi:hypothetical protein
VTRLEFTRYDDLLRQLVGIAKSEFRQALNILFVNHRLLPSIKLLPTNRESLAIIKVNGSTEEAAKEAAKWISSAKNKFAMSLPQTLRQPEPITSTLKQLEAQLGKSPPEEIIPELVNRLMKSQLSEPIPLVEKIVLEGCIALLLEYYLVVLWPKQKRSIEDLQTISDSLTQQGLLQPWLQVSVCTKCGNFELIIGSHPTRESACPRCNTQPLRVQLNIFDERLSELKMSNDSDLPSFISKYLETMSPSCKAEPSKFFTPDTEVDVYVKHRNIGIECKTFLRELAISEEDVKNRTGELIEKLERYWKVGIKKTFTVTSLQGPDAKRLEDNMRKKAQEKKMSMEIRVIPGNIDELINVLDNEILVTTNETAQSRTEPT